MERKCKRDHVTVHLIEKREKLCDEAEHREPGNDSRPANRSCGRSSGSSNSDSSCDEHEGENQRQWIQLEKILVSIAVDVVCERPEKREQDSAKPGDKAPESCKG